VVVRQYPRSSPCKKHILFSAKSRQDLTETISKICHSRRILSKNRYTYWKVGLTMYYSSTSFKFPSLSFKLQLIFSVLISLLLYIFLRIYPGTNAMWILPRFHFYVVSITLVLATISSIVIGRTGSRLRDTNVLLLSLGLLSLSGCFLVHGLSTQGFIIPDAHHLAGVSSQIALSTCAGWMYLSTFPSDHRLIRHISKYRNQFIWGWLALIIALNIIALIAPQISDFIPLDVTPLNYTFAVLTIGFYVWVGIRYFRQYQLAGFPMHGAIVYGSILLSITEFIMVTTMMWTPAWWLYHVILVASTAILLSGVIAQYKSNVFVSQIFHQNLLANSRERFRINISNSMQNLIHATEKKDPYTVGHNFRVAMYALQLARTMGIGAELQSALVRGGVIHDVGKIYVPGEILNKPGKLTPEERIIIEQHPVTGYEMCRYIGFMAEELGVIRFHHEKWDGTGYPDKLKGTQIPLLARILAVADVYDALTSHRAYRKPWPHERAMQVIQEGAGTHFDPDCVLAWIRLCNSDEWVNPEVAESLHKI
jgi:putative nucleotidyltransferase with HDIG domain